jgi:hypothetical protein
MKESVVVYFKLISQCFHKGTEEKYERLSQVSRRPGRDANRETPEYKSETLPLETRCSTRCHNEKITILIFTDVNNLKSQNEN